MNNSRRHFGASLDAGRHARHAPLTLPVTRSPVSVCRRWRLAGLAVIAGLLAGSGAPLAQTGPTYAWTNLAGQVGTIGSADGTGSAAQFHYPTGVTVDSAGNVFVADTSNNTIRKITPAGVVTTLAGRAGNTGSANGTGSAARFNHPTAVVVDGTGNLYVTDYYNCTIRKVNPAGTNWVVTTLAGRAGNSGSADGTNSAAQFYYPGHVTVDALGNLFVADQYNQTIRKMSPAGTNWVVTTLAGRAGNSGSADGTNSAAQFYYPSGVAVDNAGNVFVSDQFNHTIRKVSPAGTNWVVTTLAGSAGNPGSTDGTNNAARFNNPCNVAVDSTGNLYVADMGNHTIRKISPAGVVTTIGGSAGAPGSADGTGSAAGFNQPFGVAVDSIGVVYVADFGNHRYSQGTPLYASLTIITPSPLPTGVVGLTYTQRFQAASGTLPYKWAVIGKLPAGLKLNDTGLLAGKPTAAGTNSFKVCVTDAAKQSVTNNFNLLVRDIFGPLAGTYNGLILHPTAPAFTNSGAIKLVLSKTGSYTINLSLGGTTLTCKGQFDAAGNATNTTPVHLVLKLDATGQISGTVAGSGFTSTVLANLAAFTGRHPCPWAGKFNTLLEPTTNNPAVPQGDGYAVFTVTPSGSGAYVGKLADGTALSVTMPVSKQGTWPLYKLLYANKGAVIGWLSFTPSNTVTAVVDWFKPPTSGRYSVGFNTALTLTGTKLAPPAGVGTWDLTLAAGDLPSNVVWTVAVSPTGKVTLPPADAYKLKLGVTPTTGKFTGSFVHPVSTKTVPFTGLFLQAPENDAGGFFLGPNTSGAVTLEL